MFFTYVGILKYGPLERVCRYAQFPSKKESEKSYRKIDFINGEENQREEKRSRREGGEMREGKKKRDVQKGKQKIEEQDITIVFLLSSFVFIYVLSLRLIRLRKMRRKLLSRWRQTEQQARELQ